MTSIGNLPMDQAYIQICAPACESMVGGSFRIDHLTSQKGLTLNGKTCRVIKFTPNPTKNPELRLQCKLDEGGPPILLKGTNLVRVEANIMRSLMEGSSAPLPDDRIIAGLRLALEEHATNPPDIRRDLNHRIKLYRRLLKKLENARRTEGNALANEQYCFPCGATYVHDGEFEDSLDYMLTMSRPACVGNNQVDMRFMDLGLKGNGIVTCNICTELLETDFSSDEVLVTLPCVHMFHESCLREWLQSDIGRMNWNCPTCRHPVPHNLSTYHVNYDAQLCNRFKEFLLSGFCPSCILWVMEKDRNQVTPAAVNDRGERMTMGCVGQMQTGKVFICPPRRSK